tara:strand:- start:91 stop:396 length:306 start_codon:yes stop_codon:yes gene_type:complete
MRLLNNITEAQVIPITQDETWWQEFGGAFWLTMSGAVFAFLVAVLNALIKSRCKSYSCCFGLFTAVRNFEDDVISNAGDGAPPIINNPSNVDLEAFGDARP